MREKLHQHTIPRFYLKGFTDPTDSAHFWVYNIASGKVTLGTPKKTAARDDFYSLEIDDPEGRLAVEHMLEKIESETGSIFRKINAQNYFPSDDDKDWLAWFVAIMMARVTAVRDMMNIVAGEQYKSLLKEIAEEDGPESRQSRELVGWSKDELLAAIDSNDFQPNHNMHLKGMIDNLPRLHDRILEMNWALLSVCGEDFFITSDRPVVPFDSTAADPWKVGFANRKVQVTFPLNSQTCLLMTWTGPKGRLSVSGDYVKPANFRTATGAHAFFISPRRYPWLDSLHGEIHEFRKTQE